MCHSTPRPRWLLQPTDHATIRAPPVRWPIRLLLGLTAAKTVRRARASGRVWKPDSASFEGEEEEEREGGGRTTFRLIREESIAITESDRGEDLDGGRQEWEWEGDLRKCSHISWKKEKKPSVLWPRIRVQNAESMPPTHAYGTSRDGNSDSTAYSSSTSISSSPYNGKH